MCAACHFLALRLSLSPWARRQEQDVAIACRFTVGLLSEMPPQDHMNDRREVTCLLGLNINAGQEIKLRLRTNDMHGFRKYDRIRETLVHELTHNVWGEHDNNFKELNSRLLRECVRINQQHSAAQSVLGHAAEVRMATLLACKIHARARNMYKRYSWPRINQSLLFHALRGTVAPICVFRARIV